MSRVDDILNYKKNQEIEEKNQQIQKDAERKVLVERVRELKPRIDQILAVGDACRDAGIPLKGQAFGMREDYTTHQFITNSWSHLVGFVDRGGNSSFAEVGFNGGGACGPWHFRTNGVQVYEVHEDSMKTQEPQIHHLKKFLKYFDILEKAFYDYVDQVTEKNKDVVPMDPEKVEESKPVEISGNRLSVLLYNSIQLFEEYGSSPKDIMADIGITEKEYEAIVGRKVKEQSSLDSMIDEAEGKKTVRENSTQDMDVNLDR